MGRRRKGQPPPYLRHKATGQAYLTLGGNRIYLGPHGSPESRRRYREELRTWERQQSVIEQPLTVSAGCSIEALCAAYLQHARQHYRHADGEPTEEYRGVKLVLARLLAEHARAPAASFRPSHLKALRQQWIDTGLSRESVNKYTGRVRRLFRWAVGEELVGGDVLLALEQVPDLQPGRSDARETEPVPPVEEVVVAATLPFLNRHFAAMVRLQLLIGCRPGELCRIRGEEIDRSGTVRLGRRTVQLPGVWAWKPQQHKTRHKGKTALYLVGPQAQAILGEWLTDDPRAYLFQPRQALAERWDNLPSVRRRRNFKSIGHAGIFYQEGSYYTAVQVAAEKAGVEPWGPNRLRHTAATRYDHEAGIQLASTILGHSDPDTSLIYAASNLERAAEYVARLG